MTPSQLATLRAALALVIPQNEMDLALRLDRMMAEATGNGWRYETLPTDPRAYQDALDTLEAAANARFSSPFGELAETERLALLLDCDAGELADGAPLGAEAMKLWFEELRSDAVRLYVAHPAVIERIGYEGSHNGAGDGAAFEGWSPAEIEGRR